MGIGIYIIVVGRHTSPLMTARLAAGGAAAAAGTRRPVGVRRTRVRPRTPRDGRTRPAQTYLPTYLPTYLALIREISKYFTNSILELLIVISE